MTHPWQPGAVTGIGSLPGTDPHEAAALVFGELPDLAHVPELPDRGAGADMIGRTAALLVDLPVEIAVGEWRLTARPGRDLRRARDFLAWDLDAVEVAGAGYFGPLKMQAVGPWTLAASLELANGNRVLTDHGATRDLIASLADGIRTQLAELARRVPGASVVLQLDEPSLPMALAGRIPTASGWGTIRTVEGVRAEQGLREVLGVAPEGARVVHCCAADVPIVSLRTAGADAISLDASLLNSKHYDALGETVDAEVSLWLGVAPSTGSELMLDDLRAPLYRLWNELGFPREQLAAAVVATPACGLAGAAPSYVRRVLSLLRDLGKAMQDEA